MKLPNADRATVDLGKITDYLLNAGHPEVRHTDSRHGRKFVVDGAIQAPQARLAIVRTIWIVDAGQDVPRLVTAYPG